MQNFSLRQLFYFIACCAIAIVLVMMISRSAWWNGGVAPIPFDSDQWKANTPIGGFRTIRSAMVDDLLDRYDFLGWSTSEIEGLLGPPERQPANSTTSEWDVVYPIGRERAGWLSIDGEYLVFDLDSNGTVVVARRIVD